LIFSVLISSTRLESARAIFTPIIDNNLLPSKMIYDVFLSALSMVKSLLFRKYRMCSNLMVMSLGVPFLAKNTHS
jgi:hypothetical protein